MTSVHSAVSVEDFEKYARAGRTNASEVHYIASLLAKLSQTEDLTQAQNLCKDAIASLSERYDKSPSTRCSYASAYRKGFKAMAEALELDDGIRQICIATLKASDADASAVRSKQARKTRAQRSNLTPFNPEAVLEAIQVGLGSEDWRENAAALIMACHARPVDLLKLGEFKLMSKYQVEFTSRAKKKNGKAVGVIWTLVPAVDFINGFEKLRRDPTVVRMRTLTEAQFDSSWNSSINRAVERIFGEVLPLPYQETGEASCKNLRSAGVAIAQYLYGHHHIAMGELATRQLLHDTISAEVNYTDYCLESAEGKAITDIGIRNKDVGETVPYYFYSYDSDGRLDPHSLIPNDNPEVIEIVRGRIKIHIKPVENGKPKTNTKWRPTVDLLNREAVENFDGDTFNDRLTHVVAQAQQSQRLEEKLTLKNEELSQIRNQLARLRIALIAAQGTQLKPDTADLKIEYGHSTLTQPEHEAPISDDSTMELKVIELTTDVESCSEPEAPVASPFQGMSNADLLTTRKRGAAEERLRRSFEAIQQFNQGRPREEQIAANTGSLRKLSRNFPKLTQAWCKAHDAELKGYANAQGHNYRQNVGKDLSVIKWDENTYGAYDWPEGYFK